MTFHRESTIHALCKASDELILEIISNNSIKAKRDNIELINALEFIVNMLPENGIRGAYSQTLSLQNKVAQLKKAIRKHIFNNYKKGDNNND